VKCPNCGKDIKENGVNYCPRCGQSLEVGDSISRVTKIKIEYDEAKRNENGWGIAAIIFIICGLIGVPFIHLLGLPPLIIGLVCLAFALHYGEKAKKLKNQL